MRVARLKLANVRAIQMVEVRFRQGFNLIIGVNGVGKTTILDALAACLCDVVRSDRRWAHVGARRFDVEDIRVGARALDIECECENRDEQYCSVQIHEARERGKSLRVRRPALPTTPDNDPAGVPLAALFSTARAVPKQRASAAQSAPAGVDAALAGALSSRELRLDQFVNWIQALDALGDEHPIARGVLETVQDAVARFLPNYRNLRLEGEGRTSLIIDRAGATLPVHLLSDGERGVLSLVLDLARRLSWANPDLQDPVAESEAVVLIDELELHLHPKWQRQIVHQLQATFPRCQFIATTHSPQIIGELAHDQIHVMTGGEVYSPTHSFGVDSSRVLEEIMDADSRNGHVQGLLSQISNEIGKNRFADARQLIDRLIERVGENDPEVTRLRTLLDFLEGEE